jgi:hypothetical membrane protein
MHRQAREGIIQAASREFSSKRGAPVSSSPSTTRQEARRLELIAAGVIVGLAFFAAIALLLPLVSEYSLTADYISELAIGRYGYLQTAAFFAVGGSSLALAVGIRVVTKGSWGSPIGSTFIGLYGLGGILVGRIFPTDEVGAAGRVESPTSVGTIHIVVSALAFVFGIAGMFVLSRTFKRDARWRAFWPWSLVLAVAALVGFFLQSEVPWVGLSQRIFVGTITLWLVLVAFRLRSIAKAASAVQPPRVR